MAFIHIHLALITLILHLDIIMDLNARPKRNFWEIFHCCHKNSAQSNDEENDENTLPTKFAATDNYAFTPMKCLNTDVMISPSAADKPHTPSTVAISDFSFDTQDSKLDFSEVAKEETEEESSGSEEDDSSFIYDNMTNVAEQQDDDVDSVPDMDSYLNDNGDTKAKKDSETQKRNQAAAGGVTFYHFFLFMVLRHFFGALLLRGVKETSVKKTSVKKTSYWEKFMLLTNRNSKQEENDDKSSKEIRRKMKLRQLKLGEGKCEVYPSLSDVPTIPEDEALL